MQLKYPLLQEETGENAKKQAQEPQEPEENVTLNRMRGKGKAERLWEKTRDIEEAVEHEDGGDGTLLGGRKTPEIPVHVQQPPTTCVLGTGDGQGRGTEEPTAMPAPLPGPGEAASTQERYEYGDGGDGITLGGRKTPEVPATHTIRGGDEQEMERDDVANCGACNKDFVCELICMECVVMKCTKCTSYQTCGMCDMIICRQCSKRHGGGTICRARSENAHLQSVNEKTTSRRVQTPRQRRVDDSTSKCGRRWC